MFTKNEEDEKKISILACNEQKLKPFVRDEVKAWVGENLKRSIDNKPEWFMDYRKWPLTRPKHAFLSFAKSR